jgi:hypothetical protein
MQRRGKSDRLRTGIHLAMVMLLYALLGATLTTPAVFFVYGFDSGAGETELCLLVLTLGGAFVGMLLHLLAARVRKWRERS